MSDSLTLMHRCGVAALGAALIAAAAALPAEAQSGSPALSLGLGKLQFGCPFLDNTSEERNTGFLDDRASYAIAHLPMSLPEGASLRIEGTYPAVRYFSHQSYDGARGGNIVDSIPDARIAPEDGGELNEGVARLPNPEYGERYTVHLRYTAPPANPADREPNVLYMGNANPTASPTRVAKQVLYRIYLPNPGVDRYGDEPLPRVIYSGPTGEFDLGNTPDAAKCRNIERLSGLTIALTPFVIARPDIQFVPITNSEESILYPNKDSTYLRAGASRNHGRIIVVRTRRVMTPPLPPLLPEIEPEARYTSLCHYEPVSSAVVGCVTDRDAVPEFPEGTHDITVIARAADRPPSATAANGFNWSDWGDKFNKLMVLRQILAEPDFAGNYQRAVDAPEIPLSQTLGEYAPEVTYCTLEAFESLASVKGTALINACRLSTTSSFSLRR